MFTPGVSRGTMNIEHALVGRRVRVRHGHHDQEGGVAGVRGEPLLAVDHPLVAVPRGAAGEHLGVGAAVGLGHRVAGHDLVVEQRREIALLVRFAPVVSEDLRVARVGRLAAEDHRREARAAEDLVHQGQLELAVARSAELRPQMAGPQLAALHLILKRADQVLVARVRDVVGALEQIVERLDLGADEVIDPVELLLELGVGFKIPGHGASSSLERGGYTMP